MDEQTQANLQRMASETIASQIATLTRAQQAVERGDLAVYFEAQHDMGIRLAAAGLASAIEAGGVTRAQAYIARIVSLAQEAHTEVKNGWEPDWVKNPSAPAQA